MRIISGEFRGSRLESVPGDKTRPTTDFVREAIFSILFDCEGQTALDLFAGSGALGLEALSRGADHVTLVDCDESAFHTQQKNIEKLHCGDRCRPWRMKVSVFLARVNEKFDLIFMDPPYCKSQINRTIETIFEKALLKDNGRIVIEHSRREPIEAQWKPFVEMEKDYGNTLVTILSISQEADIRA